MVPLHLTLEYVAFVRKKPKGGNELHFYSRKYIRWSLLHFDLTW